MLASRPSFRLVPLLNGVLLVAAAATAQEGITRLETPAPPGSGMYSMASSPEGAAFLSWVEPTETGHALRFSQLLDGEASAGTEATEGTNDASEAAAEPSDANEGERWGPPRPIAEGADWFANWADHPGIAALSGNRLAAHWLVRNPEAVGDYGYGFRMVYSTDGGANWREVFSAGLDNVDSYSGFVSYAAEQGGFSAVYLAPAPAFRRNGDEHAMTLRAVRIHAQGYNLGNLELDALVCNCCPTSMASVNDEPFVVVRDRVTNPPEDDIRDIAIARKVRGRWGPARPVHRDGWELNACPVNGPVAAARNGLLAVAWFTAASGEPEVRIAYSMDGGSSFDPPFRLDGGGARGQTALAMLDDGSAVAAWLERGDGGQVAVRMRRVWADGLRGPSVTVAAGAAGRRAGVLQLVRVADPPPPEPDEPPAEGGAADPEAEEELFDPRERLVIAWGEESRIGTAVVRPAALED